jgi:hypothetical protein
MAAPPQESGRRRAESKEKARKSAFRQRQSQRDVPIVPTPQEIESSISSGKTLPLSEFVKRNKLS